MSSLVYQKFSLLINLLFVPNARGVESRGRQDYKDDSGFHFIKSDSVTGSQDIKIASVVKFTNLFC